VKINKSPYLLIIVLVVWVVGCSNKDSNAVTYFESKISTIEANNGITQGIDGEPIDIDPAYLDDDAGVRIANDLFAGLVDYNESNQIIPGLASSWDITEDGKTYIFHLRNNIKFSNGSTITANDFVYSWIRYLNSRNLSQYNNLLDSVRNAKDIRKGLMPSTSLGIAAKNNNTFIVYLNAPDPAFLNKISLPELSVVPSQIIEKYGSNWTNPQFIVTSGAYVLKEHVVNGYILAVKNPYYYDAKHVLIKKVKYLPYKVDDSQMNYTAGTIDVAYYQVPEDAFPKLKNNYGSEIHNVLEEAMYYLDLNMADPDLADNLKLRQALSMAIDREYLTQDVLKESEVPLYSVVTPTINNGAFKDLSYSWAKWPRNKQIDAARNLFLKAGYNANNPFYLHLVYSNNKLNNLVIAAVIKMWKDVFKDSIYIDLVEDNKNVFNATVSSGLYQVANDIWFARYNDVSTYTVLFYCQQGDEDNQHYCNYKYNKLIDQALIESNPLIRESSVKQALEIPLNDYTIIPLFQLTYQKIIKNSNNDTPNLSIADRVQTKWFKSDNTSLK
jgi:oligopeptide transport system substrate-binding protein